MQRAAFLDRDGVLIEQVHHLHQRALVRLLPGAAQAVRSLVERGWLAIVITNQSAVARGLCSEEELLGIHEELALQLAVHGARVDDILYCPHHPTEGIGRYRVDCSCRKPAPGMILEAQQRHGIDLASSFLVGDKASDIEAARRAGCRSILVRTGHGESEIMRGLGSDEQPEIICADLTEAARLIAASPRP